MSEAIRKTIEAVRGDGRAGVVWHTQGSGKSMEMELYANQVLTHPSLGNPTIVVLTDRTDLDDQLYGTFQASELLPESPSRSPPATSCAQAWPTSARRDRLHHAAEVRPDQGREGKRIRHPLLSDRRNIVVIVDEAHRSHYDDLDGYARHLRDALPYATMIAFTGTPISEAGGTPSRYSAIHRGLRPDPGRERRGDGPGLLREPPHPARPARGRRPADIDDQADEPPRAWTTRERADTAARS